MANINNINEELDSLEHTNSYVCQPEDCPSFLPRANYAVKIFHINIRSINKNFEQLRVLLTMTNVGFDIISTVLKIIQNNTKTSTVTRKSRILKPWISLGLLRCIRHRDRLHIKATKAPDNMTAKLIYSRYRNYCNRLLRKLKTTYEKSLIEKAGNDPKALWTAIKNITNTQKVKVSPTGLLQIYSDPKTSINHVCDFFASIGQNLADKILASKSIQNNNPITPSASNLASLNSPVNSIGIMEVDESVVESIILQLRTDSATGWDGISSQIIKQCRHILLAPITHICNIAINSGVFPDMLKKAIVHPIYKNGDRDCVNNYRPIAVLPCISKILEKILNRALKNFLEKFKILATNQYGFRSGYSTEDTYWT